MSNARAIRILSNLIEVVENKDGEWSKVVFDRFENTMLDALKRAKDNIGTDYVDVEDV